MELHNMQTPHFHLLTVNYVVSAVTRKGDKIQFVCLTQSDAKAKLCALFGKGNKQIGVKISTPGRTMADNFRF